MPEEIKELVEKKIAIQDIFITVFNDGIVEYEDYKKFLTKEEFDNLVKNTIHLANIYEESWGEKNE